MATDTNATENMTITLNQHSLKHKASYTGELTKWGTGTYQSKWRTRDNMVDEIQNFQAVSDLVG